jgi:hypothetical protein
MPKHGSTPAPSDAAQPLQEQLALLLRLASLLGQAQQPPPLPPGLLGQAAFAYGRGSG